MSFRDHKVLGVVGYFLVGVVLLSFVARVIFNVATGHALEQYSSGTLIQWTYGGALVMLIVGGAALIVAGAARLLYWYRRR